MDTPMQNINVDVAIIGAGFSGLQAALKVNSAGLSCALIEAHDRVGGKSLTTQLNSMNGVTEMGPTWINNNTQPSIATLVDRYHLTTVEQYVDGLTVMYTADGAASTSLGTFPDDTPEDDLVKLQELIALLEMEAQKFDTHHPGKWINDESSSIPDVSLDEFLQQKNIISGTLLHDFFALSSRGLFGLEPKDIGMHFFLDVLKQGHGFTSLTSEDRKGAQYQRIKEGTSIIAQRMAEDLPAGSVMLGAPVHKIVQHNTSSTVHTTSGRTITATKVILTAPSHTYTYIDFVPPVPQRKRDFASSTLRGHYAKTVVTYRTPWWRDLGLVGKFHSAASGPITTSWEMSTLGTGPYSLALFSCARDYDTLFSIASALERQKSMLDDLAKIIGAAVGDDKKGLVYDIAEYKEQDWYEKAYIEGAPMAAIGPGDFARLAPVAREIVGHVHFAGTETASEWKGYMEGAVEAGTRAAEEVIRLLKSQIAK